MFGLKIVDWKEAVFFNSQSSKVCPPKIEMKQIDLIYTRLPDKVSHFKQKLIYFDETVIVTQQKIRVSKPLIVNGDIVLGNDYMALWFIFPSMWYDIGKIHNPSGTLTGYYCDIISPMKRFESEGTEFVFSVEITDLCLDLWVCPDSSYQILDEDEFEVAVKNGWIDESLAQKAGEELDKLIQLVKRGGFPPEIVEKPSF